MIRTQPYWFARTALVLVTSLYLCGAATASRLQPGAGDLFYGMRLGETTTQLRASLGHPAMKGFNEHAVFWSYRIDGNNAWRVAIIQHDRIAGVYIRQAYGRVSRLGDGHGLEFGDSISAMFAKRGNADPLVYSTYNYPTQSGVYLLYEITKGKITGIGITRWYDYPLPFLSTYDRRDGRTVYRAFVVTKADGSIVEAESLFLGSQTCDNTGSWAVLTHTTFDFEGRAFDRVLVACSKPIFHFNFYFDITSLVKTKPLRGANARLTIGAHRNA